MRLRNLVPFQYDAFLLIIEIKLAFNYNRDMCEINSPPLSQKNIVDLNKRHLSKLSIMLIYKLIYIKYQKYIYKIHLFYTKIKIFCLLAKNPYLDFRIKKLKVELYNSNSI